MRPKDLPLSDKGSLSFEEIALHPSASSTEEVDKATQLYRLQARSAATARLFAQ